VKRIAAALSATLAIAVVMVSCRQVMPSNRYLRPRSSGVSQSTAEARRAFDHAHHAELFAAKQIACGDCHRFDAQIESADPARAAALSQRALRPGAAACHYCHVEADTKMAAAPGTCTTCHENLAPLRPADHDLSWSKVHAAIARTNAEECQTCHKQADCIDCHQRRDTIQTVVHDRSFRFFHGIEARANPMQCGSCHREDFCIRCHQQGKVDLER
jgi:hypothetical protein